MQLSRADLHIHTNLSDGAASPAEIARALAESRLAVAAVTDHDTVEGALHVRQALAGQGPEIVTGAEVSSTDGHVLALFIERDVPAHRTAEETVQLIHDQGGLAVAPHPYFPIQSLGDLAADPAFDGVETANGTPLGELANSWARHRLAWRARARIGSSDAHLVSAVGHVHTLFPGRSAVDLRAAIERGETQPVFDWRLHLRIAPRHLARAAWPMLQQLAAPLLMRQSGGTSCAESGSR